MEVLTPGVAFFHFLLCTMTHMGIKEGMMEEVRRISMHVIRIMFMVNGNPTSADFFSIREGMITSAIPVASLMTVPLELALISSR